MYIVQKKLPLSLPLDCYDPKWLQELLKGGILSPYSSSLAGRLHSHLASERDTTDPGQSPAQDRFFLTFGETGRAPDKWICPLGKVLTYKNLIYY